MNHYDPFHFWFTKGPRRVEYMIDSKNVSSSLSLSLCTLCSVILWFLPWRGALFPQLLFRLDLLLALANKLNGNDYVPIPSLGLKRHGNISRLSLNLCHWHKNKSAGEGEITWREDLVIFKTNKAADSRCMSELVKITSNCADDLRSTINNKCLLFYDTAFCSGLFVLLCTVITKLQRDGACNWLTC